MRIFFHIFPLVPKSTETLLNICMWFVESGNMLNILIIVIHVNIIIATHAYESGAKNHMELCMFVTLAVVQWDFPIFTLMTLTHSMITMSMNKEK